MGTGGGRGGRPRLTVVIVALTCLLLVALGTVLALQGTGEPAANSATTAERPAATADGSSTIVERTAPSTSQSPDPDAGGPGSVADVVPTLAGTAAPAPDAAGGEPLWEDVSPPFDVAYEDVNNFGMQALAVAPSDPDVVYVGTSYRGIWRTTDRGETWTKVSTGANGANLDTGRNWALAVDPTDADTVFVANGFGEFQGLWKSVDGGHSWRQVFSDELTAETSGDIYSIAIEGDDADHMLVSFHGPWPGQTTSGVVESLDGGRTWTVHQPQPTWGVGHYVFFLDSDTWLVTTQYDGFWRTGDAGQTWDKVSDIPMTHGANQLYQASDGTWYSGGLGTIQRSTDDGRTWQPVGPPTQDGYMAVIGDGDTLWAQSANTGSATTPGGSSPITSPEDDGQQWEPYAGGQQTFLDGPMVYGFDPQRRIIYSSNWLAGVWRLRLDG